ncbi:MAG: primosomal protein N' [Gammaproteobacteria bacterium]|nr:primosomal protein N' [Gammaproteobacteria bacterium]
MPVSIIFRVAVPVPVRRVFDYLADTKTDVPGPGTRLRVPFAGRLVTGVLLAVADTSDVPIGKLKSVAEVLDTDPAFSADILQLLLWAADYYQHPVGEVLHSALPVFLRQARPARLEPVSVWRITSTGAGADSALLRRSPVQRKILSALSRLPAGMSAKGLAELSTSWRKAITRLQEHGWVEQCDLEPAGPEGNNNPSTGPVLNPDQQRAVEAVKSALSAYQCFLLYGVTGSGKTEVYLHLIEEAVNNSRQVLVMVPEISLTPQLVQRFQTRLSAPVTVIHSGLSPEQRMQAWLYSKNGKARVILGTRSAVMVPIPDLGLIIVDEEHDASYKQQDGFRYHARDIAVMRARNTGVPIVLGSATPSLESVNNAEKGHYELLALPERTGSAKFPDIHCLDLRRMVATNGLSPALLDGIKDRLAKMEQVLLFLNRRGFSPAYLCHSCGWVASCRRCDARLTYHKNRQRLRCHHCGADVPTITVCPKCESTDMKPLGEGTERIETTLKKYFPQARVVRIDRDSTRKKGALEQILNQVNQGEADIMVGTQMLSKGHDFPQVTLVGILNVDQGLYSLDFRAPEYMFQQVMQVSGRAGRGDKPGQVLVQTYHPDHALFRALKRHDYLEFANSMLEERKAGEFPPFTYLSLLRVETPQQSQAQHFAEEAVMLARKHAVVKGVQITDPMPSPMERRAGRYRVQVLIQTSQRKTMHQFLQLWLPLLEQSKLGKRARWSLDRDPIDLY